MPAVAPTTSSIDYRAIGLVLMLLILVYFVNMRADTKREARRWKLRAAATSFADALADYSEGK